MEFLYGTVVMMKKKMRERYLFDFYGELLTDKQKQILEYHYNDDYSLSEIAEVLCVSRQGIFDVVKRSRLIMESYEEKLSLMAKFLKNQNIIKEVQDNLLNLALDIDDHGLQENVLAIVKQLSGVNKEN